MVACNSCILLALEPFDAGNLSLVDVFFMDHRGREIQPNYLRHIVDKFKNCAYFYVEIQEKSTNEFKQIA